MRLSSADIVDRLHVGVLVSDLGGTIVFVNHQAAALLGRSDVVGRSVDDPAWDVVRDDGSPFPDDERPVAVVRRTGAEVRDVVVGLGHGGARVWVMVSAAPVFAPDGGFDRVVVTLIDVSTIQSRLRTSERVQASMVRAMAEGVALHAPSGAIQFANPAAERILGLSLAQLQGRAGVDPRWRLVRLDGSPLPNDEIPSEITARTQEPCTRQLGVHRASGELAWLAVSTDPVGEPVDGRVAVVATFTDITVERNAVLALEHSRAMLQQVTEAVPGVLVQGELGASGQLRLDYVSSGALDYLGFRPGQLLGSPDMLLPRVERHDRARFLGVLATQVGHDGVSLDEVVRYDHPTKGPRALRVRAQSRLVGGATMWTGVVLDVTDERRLAEQVQLAQRRQAIGAVTAGIAHNFNNALAVILPALTEFAEIVPGDLREAMDDAVGAARNAVDLVRQLMTVVRGSAAAPSEQFDVVELVREAAGLAQQIFRGQVAVSTRLALTSAPVRGSRTGLHQVFLNLLINARDALDGRPHARVELEVGPGASSGEVVVRVRDNGAGMDADTLRRLGEPFFTTKAPGRGTGLGLATAFATVRGLGGELSCSSTVGEGSEFRIALPLAPLDGAVASAPVPALDAAPPRHGRILIVDDDDAVRRVVRAALARRGFAAVEARDGAAALAAVGSEPRFDVALVDLSLGGGMSGEHVLNLLGERAPQLPVVILSGFVDDPERLARAAAILEKPIAPDKLASLLFRIIERGGQPDDAIPAAPPRE